MRSYYEPIPCGETLPLDNPHAFSASLPTYQDLVDYGQKKPAFFAKLKQAYPRIVTHHYIQEFLAHYAQQQTIAVQDFLFLLPSRRAVEIVIALSQTAPTLYAYDTYVIAHFAADEVAEKDRFFAFMKHGGFMIYSREAEALLRQIGINKPAVNEAYYDGDGAHKITEVLMQGYGDVRSLHLSSSGMNALFAGYQTIKNWGEKHNRKLFIQFGWLYADSIHILNKCSHEVAHIEKVHSLDELARLLQERGHEVAGLLTETISNPLIETPDLPELYALARHYGFKMLLDTTFATPWNCDATPYADIIIESLTKFACGHGDVMAGALLVPQNSSLTSEMEEEMCTFLVPLFSADVDRLAFEIGDYEKRMAQINEETATLVSYFENHPSVERLFHVYQEGNRAHYEKIARHDHAYGGVISVVLKGDFARSYDALNLPKGPSLGADFPLIMAYVQLAHFDQIHAAEGRQKLDSVGLSPNLLRISVGPGTADRIIEQFEKVLSQIS